MTRTDAIVRARQQLHSGAFLAELDRRVAFQTESQNPERGDALRAYLEQDLQPAFSQLDFATKLIESPSGKGPYLLAEYRENSSAPTVLMYGHGDVVDGMIGEWRDNLDPWRTTTVGDRVYGRGTADNKGQHSINMSALRAVRRHAAAGSASMPSSSSRPARRSGRRICARCANPCAMSCRPIFFWRPTDRGYLRIVLHCFWAAVAAYGFISM